MAAKKCLIAIATSLADEGLDIPSLDCVILAGAGGSGKPIGTVVRVP